VLDEGLLHGMKGFAFGCETFDGGDLPFRQRRQHQAGQDAATIDQDGAGAALALVTALLRTGEPQLLAQGVQQCDARIEHEAHRLPVDIQFHRNFDDFHVGLAM
jgi:hypothetical protein